VVSGREFGALTRVIIHQHAFAPVSGTFDLAALPPVSSAATTEQVSVTTNPFKEFKNDIATVLAK